MRLTSISPPPKATINAQLSRGVQLRRWTQGHARRKKVEAITRKETSRYIPARTRRALAGLSILLVEVERLTEENKTYEANQ
jgi:hypothetical protein